MSRDRSQYFDFGQPFEAPMRAGLGSLHWRYKMEFKCRVCGGRFGVTWACPRLRWGVNRKTGKWEPVRVRKPTDEMVASTLWVMAHNHAVGTYSPRPGMNELELTALQSELRRRYNADGLGHAPSCPTAKLPRGDFRLEGLESNQTGYGGAP